MIALVAAPLGWMCVRPPVDLSWNLGPPLVGLAERVSIGPPFQGFLRKQPEQPRAEASKERLRPGEKARFMVGEAGLDFPTPGKFAGLRQAGGGDAGGHARRPPTPGTGRRRGESPPPHHGD